MAPHDPFLRELWTSTWRRLQDKALLGPRASLSLRVPGQAAFWLGTTRDPVPRRVELSAAATDATLHAVVYRLRPDVGAIAEGGGPFGHLLADFEGVLPPVFDEQVRHLGRMGPPAHHAPALAASLSRGGNVVLHDGVPLCLGTTAMRLMLNSELFEKCAKAYVLAAGTGGTVKPLPWIVRHVANGRLLKDERRAAESLARGELPAEAKGY